MEKYKYYFRNHQGKLIKLERVRQIFRGTQTIKHRGITFKAVVLEVVK